MTTLLCISCLFAVFSTADQEEDVLPIDQPYDVVCKTIESYFKEKHKSEANDNCYPILQLYHSVPFPFGPSVSYVESTAFSKEKIRLTHLDLFTFNDDSCVIRVSTSFKKISDGSCFSDLPPINASDIRKIFSQLSQDEQNKSETTERANASKKPLAPCRKHNRHMKLFNRK